MNTFFAKVKGKKVYTSTEEVLHDWHTGVQFRSHSSELPVTVADELKMKMSGFTHLQIVWWDGEQVQWWRKELT
jgi:hypothetical protein